MWSLTPRLLLLLGFMHVALQSAQSQEYPTKPIRIVTAPPGGTADFAARFVAQALSSAFTHTAVVDNRGGGIVPGEFVSKAPADGYTLLVHGSPLWLAQFMRSKVPFDVQRDFFPISFLTRSPSFLVVHPALPVKSVKDLIALAKAKPGALNYSAGSPGSSAHLVGELFKTMSGVKIERISYKSNNQEISELLSGETQLTFGTAAFVSPHVKSGRLRALAVSTAQPSSLFPGLPTIASSGLPGFEAATFQGAFAPAGTSAAIINRLNQVIVSALESVDAKERFLSLGVEPAAASPLDTASLLKADIAKWGKVIREAGITPD